LKDKDRDGICDSDEVYGCRDRAAYNFNDFATKDDGSCRYFSSDRKVNDENKAVFGCKDRAAYNFNDFATKDDGSCRYFSSVKEDKCENKLYHAVVYQVVEVNGECWFAENLRTRKFNDGSSLMLYDKSNTTAQTKATEMGLTYNYHAVSTSRLCPVGWSVPSLEDWSSALKGGRSADVLNGLNLHPFDTFDVYGNEKRRLEYWLPDPIDFRNAESILIDSSESQLKSRIQRRNKREMLGIRCKTD
jgi:hypothetical protein